MDSQVQEIKDKLSINDVVSSYVTLQRAGRNFRARCPFHKERTPSFMVSPERGTYVCFGCGEKGDIFSFVQKMDGVDFPTALRQLAERAGVKLNKQFTQAPQDKAHDERLADVCEAATKFFESTLAARKDVADYIRARGVTDETTKSWRLGYAPASWRDLSEHLVSLGFKNDEIADAGLAARSEKKAATAERTDGSSIYDRFRGRIMFPLFDANGKVIAFSGRIFEEMPNVAKAGMPDASANQAPRESAKYVNSPETVLFKKSRVLYGLNKAKLHVRDMNCFLLVEGQFDVVMCHQSGYSTAVALSGTALTPEHLSLLGRYSKNLVLALDADSAGIRAGLRSTMIALAQGFDVKIPTFPAGKDPADVAKENPELLKAAVGTSKTAIEFFLEVLRPQAKDERAYKKFVEAQILPLVASLQSSIDQEHFIRIIAGKLGVSEVAVRTEVAKKPALQVEVQDTVPVKDVVAMEVSHTTPEKAAGMLMFYFTTDETLQKKLQELLGAERYASIKTQLEPQAEVLRFTFESWSSSFSDLPADKAGDLAKKEDLAATTQSLLGTIERSVLEEEMNVLQRKLGEGNNDEQAILHKLSFLKRRQQELRK